MHPLQSAILSLFDEQLMPDTSIIADGKEIRAHRAILVACSGHFREHFQNGGSERMEVPLPYKAVRAMIRFLYFGSITESGLGPEDALDLLISARDWGIDVLTEEDVVDLIVPQLTNANCLNVLLHQEMDNRPHIAHAVCQYVGAHFFELIQAPITKVNLLKIKKSYLLDMLKELCQTCNGAKEAETVVNFCLEYCSQDSPIDNACDLLRDCKQWGWNFEPNSLTKMRDPKGQKQQQGEPQAAGPTADQKAEMSEAEMFDLLDVNKDGVVSREEFTQFKKAIAAMEYNYVKEWKIPKIKGALSGEPLCHLVAGDLFEWRVRVDNGPGDGKLRIVYEDVVKKNDNTTCCQRFPAATFAWKVQFRGEEIFNDRPVFITFAERVALHWSTTLSLDSNLLTDDDEITISVVMTENPLLSLILYFLSTHVKDESYAEDILNRLPHIEYRCLSSFFIFRQASRPPSASLNQTQPA